MALNTSMSDITITRRLSFGSTGPIDKYWSGIDSTELSELNCKQPAQFVSSSDVQQQQELFSKLKYNFIQSTTVLKMHEYLAQAEPTLDVAESEKLLKAQKQQLKKMKSEQQKIDQEIRDAVAHIMQLQEKYQEMQANLKGSLAPYNQPCDIGGKEKQSISVQTEGEYREQEEHRGEDEVEQNVARLEAQLQMTSSIGSLKVLEKTGLQTTLQINGSNITCGIEGKDMEVVGAYCDASFPHGDILDYAAKTNDVALMFYEMQSRLHCRDAIAADVAKIGANAKWDGEWTVRVELPSGEQATLVVDPNYGTEFGRVQVKAWSVLESGGTSSKYHTVLESLRSGPSLPLHRVVDVLSTATTNV